MNAKRKPILVLDFDGVLHSYSSGWQGAAIIPDPPVPGAVAFLHGAVERFRVCVFSSRSGQPGGIDAMRAWLTMFVMRDIDDRREAEHVLALIEWPTEKPAALITLDDRALTFDGTWPDLDALAVFQPWNKRPAVDPIATPHWATKPVPPLDRGEDADFLQQAQAVVDLIEKPPGYGTQRNSDGVRLKDQPEWVAFYNAVKARLASHEALHV